MSKEIKAEMEPKTPEFESDEDQEGDAPPAEEARDTGRRLWDSEDDDSERAWLEHLAEQGGDAAVDDMEGRDGSREDTPPAKPQDRKSPSPPAQAEGSSSPTAGQDFYLGRYRTRDDAEKGFLEKDATITRSQQENAELRRQLEQFQSGWPQPPSSARPTPAEPNSGEGGRPQSAQERLLADPSFADLYFDDPNQAAARMMQAAKEDALAEMTAQRVYEQQFQYRQAQHQREMEAWRGKAEKYRDENHPFLNDEGVAPLAESLGHRLLGSHKPWDKRTPEEQDWCRKAVNDPVAYLDEVAKRTKESLGRLGYTPDSGESPAPTTLRPGGPTRVARRKPKSSVDSEPYWDLAAEKDYEDKLFGD